MTPPIAEMTRDKVESLIGSITRYTRFVNSTKLVLAALAAILAGAILFYPVLKKDEAGVRIAFTSITKDAHTSQTTMQNARYHGLDKDNQPFNVNSKTATQVDDDTVLLDRMVSDISLKSGAWLSVSSNTGVFKTKEKLLDLKGSVEMFNDEGYEFRTELLHVNVATKVATTQLQVDGQGPLGTLKAYGGARVDSAKQVTDFLGPVFVTVYPAQNDDSKKKQGAAQ